MSNIDVFTSFLATAKNLKNIYFEHIMMEKEGYVYILASKKLGVLYTGVTSNLEQRLLQHKNGLFEGFTKKYFVHKLVRFQKFPTINEAIEYEKIIKGWKRDKKICLIEENNKNRDDLFTCI